MPNVMQILKAEITRLARKETKAKTGPLAKRLTELRDACTALRRELASQARLVAVLGKRVKADELICADAMAEGDVAKARLSSKRIAGLRKKLGLSRTKMAILLGVNANTIFFWERGKTRPRAAAKAKLIQLRSLGRRAAKRMLKEAKAAAKK